MKIPIRSLLFVACALLVCPAAPAQEQQFASLGDFKLVSGEVIRDCKIGYRTFGKMNADKSNIVVFPT
jgi:homoserine O-acetyltransferase/O-succinyltransferase